LNNYIIQYNPQNDKWEITVNGTLLDWKWDETQKKYINTGVDTTGNNPPEWQKLAGLYFQKWKGKSNHFIWFPGEVV